MEGQLQPTEALQDIRRIMNRSTRFISLSGWSGISAGICALIGAWLANSRINEVNYNTQGGYNDVPEELKRELMLIAAGVLISAVILAFFFTWLRANRERQLIWNTASRRLIWNTMLPLAAGGVFIIGMMYHDVTMFVSPACLMFYGLALVNGSKYTLGEVRYLGYGQIALSILNLWFLQYSLLLWAIGFGILHIIYGVVMWYRYERHNGQIDEGTGKLAD
jgi:hypothetical protein